MLKQLLINKLPVVLFGVTAFPSVREEQPKEQPKEQLKEQSKEQKSKHQWKIPKPPLKAILINDPKNRLDGDYTFEPQDDFIPRNAALTEGGKLRPIIIYAPTEKSLPEVKGKAKFGRSWEELTGWRYLTPTYVYQDQIDRHPQARFKTATEFINQLANGNLWESPDNMGPYQFGNCLTLSGLRRQQTKVKKLEAAIRLEKSIKLMLGCVIGAVVFLIIIQSG